jgi:NAD dependent epimerase/dehydratase family enzyme
MADEMLLASQRVMPKKLKDAGFEFEYERIDAALRKYVS